MSTTKLVLVVLAALGAVGTTLELTMLEHWTAASNCSPGSASGS